MEFNFLGNTNIKVSKICLGTMTWGEQNTESEAHQQLDYALDQGINFIDTAELYAVPPNAKTYTLTEQYLGTWLGKRTDRDQLIVASKVVGPRADLGYIRDGNIKFNREQITSALEGSLKRLQTDYLDLFQLHWPERKSNRFGKLGYIHEVSDEWEDNILEVLQVFDDLMKQGKVREFGLSNDTPWGLHRFLHLAEMNNLPKVVSVQNPYNLLNRSYEVGLAEMSIRENTGLLAYSPLAFGLLTGKYANGARPADGRITLFKFLSRYNGRNSMEASERYIKLAKENGLTPTQMALAYINSRPFLTSTIIGATTMEQLKENIDSINIQLSDEVLEGIEVIHDQFTYPAP